MPKAEVTPTRNGEFEDLDKISGGRISSEKAMSTTRDLPSNKFTNQYRWTKRCVQEIYISVCLERLESHFVQRFVRTFFGVFAKREVTSIDWFDMFIFVGK